MNESSNSGQEASEAPPTDSRSAETRARLIEATLRVLGERGRHGTSSRAIATESGVNLAGITYHFGSKDELIAQALIEAVRGWLAPALVALRADADPASRMVRAVQALQDSLTRAGDLLPVYLEALVHAPRSDTLRRGIDGLLRELRDYLAGEIRTLQSTGFLPAWIDPDPMALLIVATGDGLALHTALDPESVHPQAVAGQTIQLLLAASTRPA
ncbi:MAG: TetR/AcrR family transcriptional regulator [Actinomycetota bacterium]|nr:TetR/AcrR family transcriptional regulator [Actinomycetota bacterium]